MTNEEKFKAIVERLKLEGLGFEPMFISVMMIINYLEQIQTTGIIQCAYNITEEGKRIVAVCEEFDWAPSDEDIFRFVNELVDKEDGPTFALMIKKYRDDKEGFLNEINDELSK